MGIQASAELSIIVVVLITSASPTVKLMASGCSACFTLSLLSPHVVLARVSRKTLGNYNEIDRGVLSGAKVPGKLLIVLGNRGPR